MQRIMDNELMEGAGYTSVFATIFMWLASQVQDIHVNDVLQGVTAVLAITFVVVKINGQILDNRQKRKNLKNDKKN